MSNTPLFVIEHTPHADRVGTLPAAVAHWLDRTNDKSLKTYEQRIAFVLLAIIGDMTVLQQQNLAAILGIDKHGQSSGKTTAPVPPSPVNEPATWMNTPDVIATLTLMANDPLNHGINEQQRTALLTASWLLTA